jgi:phenylalanyl-tRNA synthetase beta chain
MKVSLNWLKELVNIDSFTAEEVGEMLTAIGLEVEGMEEVESVPGGLKGLVIGEVVECGKHPNADRLSLTKVNVGNSDLLSIVCGAPNVAAGQKVVVATVGTELYPVEGDPFPIKKGKIRGELSEGMICAEDEIGLGGDHSGIIVLPESAQVGLAAADYYDVQIDTVYEIGLTPNRSDATCHLGVARDLAAYLRVNHQMDEGVAVPDLSGFSPDRTDGDIEVVVENEEACPRYSGLLIEDLKIAESPAWLQNRLRAIDVRPINNVVDITNLVLHEFGQPLHAFDAEKIAGHKVLVKPLAEGTPFTTLDEVERKLSATDLMICDGNEKGMCFGGVFGGIGTGVTEETQAIFLESAHFNAKWIRNTSMHHNLRTDAAKVFEKGSDPNITVDALKRAAILLKELAGGKVVSDIIDLYPQPIEPVQVRVRFQRINALIGADISPDEARKILQAMEMEIVHEDEEGMTVAIPTNKADVLREVDVIEEILRIYGLNKVDMPMYIRSNLSFSKHPDNLKLKNKIGDLLAANGFHEMMALSLSQSKYYEKAIKRESSELVFVNNTSNVHLDIMRPDMLFSALEVVVHNQNRQQSDLRLFEFGNNYQRNEEGAIEEEQRLSLVVSGQREEESWLVKENRPVDFFTLKAYVDLVMQRLGISGGQETVLEDDKRFLFGLRYHRGSQVLVDFGKVQPALQKEMDIRNEVFFADFAWDNLLKALPKKRITFEELSKFFTMRRDLALVVDKKVKFFEIETIVRKAGKKLIKQVSLFDLYENEEQLGEGKKSYAIAIVFEDPSKTLKDKEVDKVISKIIHLCEQKLGAMIRK